MNSDNQTSENGRNDEAIGRLLRLAGEPQEVPEATMARSRAKVREHWQDTLATRRRTVTKVWSGRVVAMAASLAVAVFLLDWFQLTEVPELGQIARVNGQLSVQGNGSNAPLMAASGGVVYPGTVLTTGPQDRAALSWHNGHSIRLDHNTQLELVDGNRVALRQGAIYIDSGTTTAHPAPITVQTPYGSARDIGTQFTVGSDQQGMTVRVRDGLVVVASEQITIEPGAETVGRGYQLRLAVDSGAQQEKIATHGEDWDWTFETATEFDLDGKTTAEFLEWLCREQGWTLEYANLRVRQNAEKAIIHGSIEGLSAEESLTAVLRTLKMGFEMKDDTLEINEQEPVD